MDGSRGVTHVPETGDCACTDNKVFHRHGFFDLLE